MSTRDTGGTAFPATVTVNRETGELVPHQFNQDDFKTPGMSLRDYFAAAAMQGIIACVRDHIGATLVQARVAKAYEYADAMLTAREAE